MTKTPVATPITEGASAEWTVSVQNNGPDDMSTNTAGATATNSDTVVITDNPSFTYTLLDVPGNCSTSPGNQFPVTCWDIPAGDFISLTVRHANAQVSESPLQNTATIDPQRDADIGFVGDIVGNNEDNTGNDIVVQAAVEYSTIDIAKTVDGDDGTPDATDLGVGTLRSHRTLPTHSARTIRSSLQVTARCRMKSLLASDGTQCSYTVTETQVNGYTVSPASGSIDVTFTDTDPSLTVANWVPNPTTLAFNNAKDLAPKYGTIQVRKTVVTGDTPPVTILPGGTANNALAGWEFTLELASGPAGECSPTLTGYTSNTGLLTFDVVETTGGPVNDLNTNQECAYTVSETVQNGYTITTSPAGSNQPGGKQCCVSRIHQHSHPGGHVHQRHDQKTLYGDDGLLVTAPDLDLSGWSFDITSATSGCSGSGGAPLSAETGTNGEVVVQVVDAIAGGTQCDDYEITETGGSAGPYTQTTPASGLPLTGQNPAADGSTEFAFVNRLDVAPVYGDLQIIKKLKDQNGNDITNPDPTLLANWKFNVTSNNTGLCPSPTDGPFLTDLYGKVNVPVLDKTGGVYNGLTTGTQCQYTITEVQQAGYDVVSPAGGVQNPATVTGGPYTFVNQQWDGVVMGAITVNKTVIDAGNNTISPGSANLALLDWEFTATSTSEPSCSTAVAATTDVQGHATINVVAYTGGNNPADCTYTVTETAGPAPNGLTGYTTTYSQDPATFALSEGTPTGTLAVENKADAVTYADLTINKTATDGFDSSDLPDDDDGWVFLITSTQTGCTAGPTVAVSDANGEASVNLIETTDGTMACNYTVSEIEQDGWMVDANDQSVDLAAQPTVAFENTLTAVNRPPVAENDTATTSTNTEVTTTVTANDSDPDNDTPLTVTTATSTSAEGGAVSCSGTTCTYTPPPTDFVGTDTYTYEVCDPDGLCDTATVTVIVTQSNVDTDGDGVPDWVEVIMGTDPDDLNDVDLSTDTDGGGTPDWIEIMLGLDVDNPGDDPFDPAAVAGTDTDGDGVPDWVEEVMGTDPDDPNSVDLSTDTDEGGTPDWIEIMLGLDVDDPADDPYDLSAVSGTDTDGDGVPDWVEVIMGTDPDDPDSVDLTTDTDNGGTPDWIEIMLGTSTTDPADDPIDLGSTANTDTDGDGVPDWVEVIMGTDPDDPDSVDLTTDTDNGGTPDWIEIALGLDIDDPTDDPFNLGDVAGTDTDGDGVPDWVEIIMGTDPEDASDVDLSTDTDGGTPDWIEILMGLDIDDPADDPFDLSDIAGVDTDGDGVPDWVEIIMGTDPSDPNDVDTTTDTDGGGTPDWIEVMLGLDIDDPTDDITIGSSVDTDGDGVPDWVEIIMGTDPTDPDDYDTSTDTDGGGTPDWIEIALGLDIDDPSDDIATGGSIDTDGDGVPDWVEVVMGTDPTDPNDADTTTDTDGGGTPDWIEIALGLDINDPSDDDTVVGSGVDPNATLGCGFKVVGSNVVEPGSVVAISAPGYMPGTPIVIQINPILASAIVPASGTYLTTVVIPELAAGSYQLSATGTGSDGGARVLTCPVVHIGQAGTGATTAGNTTGGATTAGNTTGSSTNGGATNGATTNGGTGGGIGGNTNGRTTGGATGVGGTTGAGTTSGSATGGTTAGSTGASSTGGTTTAGSTAGRTTSGSTTGTSGSTTSGSTRRAVAFTGSDPLPLALFGAGLLLVGLNIAGVVRRRRNVNQR
ncbi:MAG: hypothetical protein H6512_12380 [Acidimicrobiia bacterium]|nr:hypothetical protein [Acidimicrobiia bacterium]